MSHFTQESLFISKAKLSVCLELTPAPFAWQVPTQSTGHVCALESATGPSSSIPDRSSNWWKCRGNGQEPTLSFSLHRLLPEQYIHLFRVLSCAHASSNQSLTTLGNTQSGSHHTHSCLADVIQGGHVICPRSHFFGVAHLPAHHPCSLLSISFSLHTSTFLNHKIIKCLTLQLAFGWSQSLNSGVF